jgi:hypothetical protein
VESSDSETEPITEISDPGTERFYLVGNDVPTPPEGTVYRVWLLSGNQATFATDFVPEPGMMVVELEFDPSLYDRVLISVEPAGSTPDTPEIAVWQTAS